MILRNGKTMPLLKLSEIRALGAKELKTKGGRFQRWKSAIGKVVQKKGVSLEKLKNAGAMTSLMLTQLFTNNTNVEMAARMIVRLAGIYEGDRGREGCVCAIAEDLFENMAKLTKKYNLVNQRRGCVAYSKKKKAWCGWSHRAFYCFPVGLKGKKGHMPTSKIGKTVRNEKDSLAWARAFADDVG